MKWGKDVLITRNLTFSRWLLIIVIVLAFVFNNKWLLFILLTGTIILFIHQFYLNQIGKNLYLDNKKEMSRLNIGEHGEWLFTFMNQGFPIVKGTLSIAFDDCIEPTTFPYIKNRSFNEVTIPFKAWTNEQVEVRIPFVAVKRGVSHIYKLEVKINHLFGSGVVLLNYNDIIKMKKLVYPSRKMIPFMKEQPILLHGFQQSKNSLFNDPLQPIGTREYVNGDSFQHIHWKATARMQQLQTKVFQNIGARTWLFVMNISERHSITHDLENLINYTAFLIEQAVKENIPFAIAINVRTHGEIPYYYLSEGEGRIQRQKAYEMLSMLSIHSFPFPHHIMLKDLDKKGNIHPVVIHIGECTSMTNQVLLAYKMKNSSIFNVETVNEQGVMREWKHYRTTKSG
ncbi:DUF58 domain-containing protein [Heyndrickxia sp. NPDC080065]|uniref:DUF58 domain-containing protein n=1 Tax=Heyndrickxia sp. NPDC080065 TaxID=3390568 RepID=UPI003D078342